MDHQRAAKILVEALQAELSGQSPSFADALENLLGQAVRAIHTTARFRMG